MKRCVLLIVFLAFALAACGKKYVMTQPDLPPLAPPPPPERVVVPAEPEDAGRGGTTQTPNPSDTEKSLKDKSTNKPRTVPAPDTAKPPDVLPPAPPALVEPPKPQLQTADAGVQEREANHLLDQADGNRKKVNRDLLNADGKQQYDTATGFIRQARLAMTENNFGLALRLAKNAVTILAALANR